MQKKIPLIIGIVLMIVSLVLINVYMKQQIQQNAAKTRAEFEARQANQTPVLVATKDIQPGSVINPDSIKVALVPNEYVVPRAATHERHRFSLGKHSLIEESCVVCTWHGDVILKDGASIGIGSVVIGPVQMGENSGCSQHCFISGQSHHYEDITRNFRRQGFETEEVIIQHDVWIGSNSVVLCGVKIGNNSVIGGGSVVAEDVPPYSVAVGHPAKVIRRYDFETGRWTRV